MLSDRAGGAFPGGVTGFVPFHLTWDRLTTMHFGMRAVAILVLITSCQFLAGCFNPTLKVDGRTAIEQQLTRAAIQRAIAELPIHRSVLEGRWKVESVGPDLKDDPWTRAMVRQRLVKAGARISTDPAEKLPVVQATLMFAGSDMDSFVAGVPLPGTMGAASLSFYHENVERGRARVRLNFWDADGKLVAQTPAGVGEAHYGDYFILTFIGPFSFTDLNDVATYGRFAEKGKDARETVNTMYGPSKETVVDPAEWITSPTKATR